MCGNRKWNDWCENVVICKSWAKKFLAWEFCTTAILGCIFSETWHNYYYYIIKSVHYIVIVLHYVWGWPIGYIHFWQTKLKIMDKKNFNYQLLILFGTCFEFVVGIKRTKQYLLFLETKYLLMKKIIDFRKLKMEI